MTWILFTGNVLKVDDFIKTWNSHLLLNLLIFLIVFFWVLVIVLVYKDIKYRTKNLFFQIICILLPTFFSPIFGWLIYLAIRPKFFYKDSLYWKEALDLQTTTCNKCWMINNFQFDYCINCWNPIHHTCKKCNQTYSYEYNYCPFCWASKNYKWHKIDSKK